MNQCLEELSPEEIELLNKRNRLKAELRGNCKAANDGNVTCTYCRCKLSQSGTRLSHVVPLSLGGLTDAKNVVLACHQCCESKHCRTLNEWSERLMTQQTEVQTLMTRHPSPERIEAPKEEATT